MIEMMKADIVIKLINQNGIETIMLDRPSHSWTKNYYQFIFSQIAGIHPTSTVYATTVTTVSGTSYGATSNAQRYRNLWGGNPATWGEDCAWCDSGTNATMSGCVIGTGTALENFTATNLNAICNNGTGTDYFVFGVTTKYFSTSSAGTVLRLKHDRTFTNNSGDTINVNEAGLYAYFYAIDWEREQFLINRDTFGTISVANGSSLYVAYTLKLTLPNALV